MIRRVPFLAILLPAFLLAELFIMRAPSILSWDGSVYVGMGKYLFSLGQVGLWEALRPVGLPILLGAAWKLGIDPYAFGQVVAALGASLAIFFAYKLGELLEKGAGRFSALLLASTSLFLVYASIPMTDILSGAFALGAAYFALRDPRRFFLSGLFAGLAFLFRFPQGLVFAALGAGIVLQEWKGGREGWKRIFSYGLGFLAIAGPFFLSSAIAYGDPLLPLRAGSSIIQNLPELYRQDTFFYFSSLFSLQRFALFALVPALLLLFGKLKESRSKYALLLGYAGIYLAYFTYLDHKELRYTLTFLPVVIVLAGAGLFLSIRKLKIRFLDIAILVLIAAIGTSHVGSILRGASRSDRIYDDVGAALRAYPGASLVSAGPFPASVSDARFVATLYDDWREVLAKFQAHKGEATHVLIDSCTLETVCRVDAGCTEGKEAALAAIQREYVPVVDGMAGACHVTLYERK